MPKIDTDTKNTFSELIARGAHYGSLKARRHPSTKDVIFGTKEKLAIIDLNKTSESLDALLGHVKEVASKGKTILFVGGKNEARKAVEAAAKQIDMPYVASRWIGGVITNQDEIAKRVKRYKDLIEQKEKGELAKYTKKERVMIDREIAKLESKFGGILDMSELPATVFVVDPRYEEIAVAEALEKNIPVMGIASTDCDHAKLTKVVPANDASHETIEYILSKVVEAYKTGKMESAKKTSDETEKLKIAQDESQSASLRAATK